MSKGLTGFIGAIAGIYLGIMIGASVVTLRDNKELMELTREQKVMLMEMQEDLDQLQEDLDLLIEMVDNKDD